MGGVAQLLRVLARAVHADAEPVDPGPTELLPHEHGAGQSTLFRDELGRDGPRSFLELLRECLEGCGRILPQRLVRSELPKRGDSARLEPSRVKSQV